ncbi:DUF1045 domain-containing protein [Rhodosalinus sp. K401]|uniref:DUF1045 domain-containing protein n=1 Tax=Rhodosalinus sp. K401 TaxID=3239195 RepID=UPI0035249AA9
MGWRRYAIYFTPEGALAERGAAWLGWDAAAGAARAHPGLSGLPRPVDEITARPRAYGFHATLKPPFRLAAGCSEADLGAALEAFAAGRPAVVLDGLEVARLGRFLALRPAGDAAALSALAAAVVEGLDPFRAPPADDEIARRRAARLTPRQEALLARWGYPYVMEEFRFHMTLTGPLGPDELAQTETVLARHFAPVLPAPFVADAVTLLAEDDAGRFHHLHRYTLTG